MLARSLARAIYVVLVMASVAIAAHRPLLFQKLNTLAPADGFPELSRTGEPLDVAAVVGSIPLKRAVAWTVHPSERYRRTILEGRGNCSQLAFGLAYQLERTGTDYQIVHLMKVGGLANGAGHTVVRTRYRLDGSERLGLVDLVGGGVPEVGGHALDVAALDKGPVDGLRFRFVNEAGRDPSRYYREHLADAVVGYVPREEVRRYYRFLETIFVPLGHEKLEKYVYDGLALLSGFLPRIYVPRYDQLMAQYAGVAALHPAALWTLRSVPVVVLIWVGSKAVRHFSGR